MKVYFIDGNNVIGKIKALAHDPANPKQETRVKLAFMLERFFVSRKAKVVLFFDGFPNEPIRAGKIKIVYSKKGSADSLIKDSIDNSKNPKLITVVSSDFSVYQYARKSSCLALKSEEFIKEMEKDGHSEGEEDKIKNISNDEMKKLFGLFDD